MRRATLLALPPTDVEAYLTEQRSTSQGKQAAVAALRQARVRWEMAGAACPAPRKLPGCAPVPLAVDSTPSNIVVAFTEPGTLGVNLLQTTIYGTEMVSVSGIDVGSQASRHPSMPTDLPMVVVGVAGSDVRGQSLHEVIEQVVRHTARPVEVEFEVPAPHIAARLVSGDSNSPARPGARGALMPTSPGSDDGDDPLFDPGEEEELFAELAGLMGEGEAERMIRQVRAEMEDDLDDDSMFD
eukprot:COSAG05_NODE_1591_length_4465_cov_35.183830_3_plen_241_part_00